MMTTYEHIPVMRDRVLELLGPALGHEGALLVDGTLGLGGHAEAFLEAFPALRLLGIDRDIEAGKLASLRLARFSDRFTFHHGRYDTMAAALDHHFPGGEPAGILLDLGVSSLHLDKPERGFSYSVDAPLDMRMDVSDDVTAEGILRTYSVDELADIFRTFGDEKLAGRYARAIVAHRDGSPLRTTAQVVDLLQSATPYALKDRGHPAKRVFQALRIEVNRECLAVGGRIVVMSYHSGEDRLVKKIIRQRSSSTAPLGLPEELPEHRSEFSEITRGAEMATPEERAVNPRSASVRTRAAQRTRKVSR